MVLFSVMRVAAAQVLLPPAAVAAPGRHAAEQSATNAPATSRTPLVSWIPSSSMTHLHDGRERRAKRELVATQPKDESRHVTARS